MDHASEAAEELLSQFRSLLVAPAPQQSKGGGGPSFSLSSLPSARQLWTVGGLLYRFTSTTTTNHDNNDSDLLFAYDHLVEALPDDHWTYVLETFHSAVHRLLQLRRQTLPSSSPNNNDNDNDDLFDATKSLNGLFTHSPRLCQWAYSSQWISLLSALYDRFVVEWKDPSHPSKYVLLATLSSVLLDGLFLPETSQGSSRSRRSSRKSLEEELLEAIQGMEEQSTDCLGDLLHWQTNHEPFRRTLESQVREYYNNTSSSPIKDEQQRDYLLQMLESARRQQNESSHLLPLVVQKRDSTAAASQRETKNPALTTTVAYKTDSVSVATEEVERRIQQIKQILPDFGEGFIETALSLFQGNVETTVATLLNEDPSSYPTALRVLDKALPRRRKVRAAEEEEDATQARQLVKERLAVEEKQEQARYEALAYMAAKEEAEQRRQQQQQQPIRQQVLLRSEYDDDYDDQYDEQDVRLGNADEGQYDDYEKVKLYNQLVRSEEAEDSFWQETANTNRTPPSTTYNNNNNKDKDSDEKKGGADKEPSWGRDKIKGGRIIGADGKIDRKPGGQRGKNNHKGGGGGPTTPPPKAVASSKNSVPIPETATAGVPPKGVPAKPRTKPKSQNRVTRQRDKKQKAQGTFGAAP